MKKGSTSCAGSLYGRTRRHGTSACDINMAGGRAGISVCGSQGSVVNFGRIGGTATCPVRLRCTAWPQGCWLYRVVICLQHNQRGTLIWRHSSAWRTARHRPHGTVPCHRKTTKMPLMILNQEQSPSDIVMGCHYALADLILSSTH